MKKLFFLLILLGLIFSLFPLSAENSGSIDLLITGLKNDQGEVDIALYNSPQGFPLDYAKAVKTARVPIKNNEATVNFAGLPEGTYALSLFHDDNLTHQFSYNFWGKPLKGYGFSDNPPKQKQAVGFSQAQFQLGSDPLNLEIKMIYW